MSVTTTPAAEPAPAPVPEEAAPLALRRAAVARQLDLLIEDRGCVQEVRRLLADLDAISADLAQLMREAGIQRSAR